jgi:hypothetical protein
LQFAHFHLTCFAIIPPQGYRFFARYIKYSTKSNQFRTRYSKLAVKRFAYKAKKKIKKIFAAIYIIGEQPHPKKEVGLLNPYHTAEKENTV